MPPSNNKKRKLALASQPAELIFDTSARQEYLTGFHRRKVARKEHARDVAIKRDREEKVVARKQLRDQRKQDLSNHIAEFNAELRKQNPETMAASDTEGEADDPLETAGLPSPPPSAAADAEYIDEEKYTTVTVSALDPTANDADDDELEREDAAKAAAAKIAKEKKDKEDAEKKKKRPWTKENPSDGRPKAKKKKFRYESKYERKEQRAKLKAKNAKAAKARKGE